MSEIYRRSKKWEYTISTITLIGIVLVMGFLIWYGFKNKKESEPTFLNNIKYKENLNFIYIKINEKDYICARDLYKISFSRAIRKNSINYFYIFYIKVGRNYKRSFDSYFFETEKEAKNWLHKIFKTNDK